MRPCPVQQSVILDQVLVDAVKGLEKLAKYAKKQPLLRQKLRGPHSAVQARLQQHDQGLTDGELSAVFETLNKLLRSPVLDHLLSQASTAPTSLALQTMAQNLVLLLGNLMKKLPSAWLSGLH